MDAENLAYPWRKDIKEVAKATLEALGALTDKINALEKRVYYLEERLPNQKHQQYDTYTSNTAGGQIIPNQAGGTSGQAWGGMTANGMSKKK